jgi:hypothetical protein
MNNSDFYLKSISDILPKLIKLGLDNSEDNCIIESLHRYNKDFCELSIDKDFHILEIIQSEKTIEILFEQVFEDFDIGTEIFKYNLLVDILIVNNLVV